MNSRRLTCVLAISLLAGCAGVQVGTSGVSGVAPPLGATLYVPDKPSVPLNGDDNGPLYSEFPTGSATAPPWSSFDAMLGGGTHRSQDGLENVRVWPASATNSQKVGNHATAKFFFQQIIKAAPQGYTSTPEPLHSDHHHNINICTVRFAKAGAATGKAEWLYVSYRENTDTNLAWIEYARLDNSGSIRLIHRHRIIFLERKSFDPTDSDYHDYYGYSTDPDVVNDKGLICVLPTGGAQSREDGGGGGEM